MTEQKRGILKYGMLPNLYILAATLQTYEKISKPVYRRTEFLFPTIKVPSDQIKKNPQYSQTNSEAHFTNIG